MKLTVTGRLFRASWCAVLLCLVAATVEAADTKGFTEKVEPVVAKYCYDCHGDGSDKGDFVMDDYESLDGHLDNMEMWYDVWKNLRSNLMPPADKKQPTDEDRTKMLAFIEREVFDIDPENPDPGVVTIRRLNREEYRNTVKDLLGVNFDASDAFPADDTGYGFDTIGAVLSISPLLMEKYIEAATEIVAKVVPLDGPQIPTNWFDINSFQAKDDPKHKLKWIPLESKWKIYGKKWVNHEGEYRVRVDFKIGGSKGFTAQTGTLKFGVNGKDSVSRKVGWDNAKSISFQTNVKLEKGGENSFYLSMEPETLPKKGENKIGVEVQSIRMIGPLDGSVKTYPYEFRHVFPDAPPTDAKEKDAYREKILRRLASKAFRRPIDEATLKKLVKLARDVESKPGKRLEHGIAHALTAILSSSRFLMRAEIQPKPDDVGEIVDLDEYALASRLSYFLWTSCPDDELLRLAGEGNLRKNIRAQVDRMLKDGKSDRFVQNFVGQWLQARDVEAVAIDLNRIFRENKQKLPKQTFDSRIRQSMRKETEAFFAHILKDNRPATELLTADYTFLNQRLAEWYGIEGVKGNDMQKVKLSGPDRRGGILRQGTFLVVTSNPTRTSPVKRGLFVLENILATPAPPAVPDVPPLENSQKGKNKDLPLKEILRIHAEDPVCASCHAKMDPIGLALENYDPLGLWREKYRGQPIETEGQLITGEKFKNAGELSHILAGKRHRNFHQALTEKLMTYAIGRGMEYYDSPTIDRIINGTEKKGGQMKEIIYGIVESAAFQKRRGDGDVFADK